MRKVVLGSLILSAMLFFTAPAGAHMAYTITGPEEVGTGGEAISAKASFSLTRHNFGGDVGVADAIQIVLTNTSATTSYRGNLLTGFFWSWAGIGSLTTNSTGFDGGATVRTSNTASISSFDIAPAVRNTATQGTYQLSNGPFGIANSGKSYATYSYGIATVGYGLAGFSGAALGGDNYGIAAAGSNLTVPNLSGALPVIDTSAVFWIKAPSGMGELPEVTRAAFTFGSQPDHNSTAVPVPGAVWLLGSGLVGLVGISRRIRK